MTTICPDAGEAGAIGQAASFQRRSYLTVSPSDNSLNLRRGDGHFTLAAWIYPTQQDGRWRGIFGSENHDHPERSYPSLYAKGSERRFKAAFGNGTQLCEVTSQHNALTRNSWQLVVAVFDGVSFKLYVNGNEVGSDASCAGTRPHNTDAFDIGRTSTAAHFSVEDLTVVDEGDGLDSDRFGSSAEYNLFVDGTRIWGNPNIVPGTYYPPGYTVYGDYVHSVNLTELDKTVEEPARGDDDLLIYEQFYNYRPNNRTSSYDEGRDGEGTLTWKVDNDFYAGRLDELRIYRRALDGYEITELYEAATRILELRFDEPPGAETFKDHSGSGNTGICDGDGCPATGLTGRSNQAVRLDGTDDDVAVELDMPQTDYTVSLWFKTRGYDDFCEDCGLFSVVGDNGRDEHLYLKNGQVCARVQTEEICTTSSDYADGEWHYLVHTVGTAVDGQRLIIDGSDRVTGTQTQAGFGAGTALKIGVSRPAGHDRFGGMIDHVVLTRKALAPAAINRLRKEVPVFNLHLDERVGATTFENVARPAQSAGCDGANDRCPGAGVDGWIYGAARFDGSSDALQVASHAPLDLDKFTIGLWVYPTQRKSIDQKLLTRENWLGETQNYALSIKPDSMTIRYEDCRQSFDSSPDALLEDQWNHVMVTHDAAAMTLYVNGAEDSVLTNTVAPCQFGTLYLGGDYATYWGTADAEPFAGSLDEVTIYGRAFSRPEVEDLYNYQVSWYDISDEHRITVDAEKPTATIVLTATAVDMSAGRVIEILAEDETSSVEQVDYRVNGGVWHQASQDGRVWMFPFTPVAEGSYVIEARAIDTAGHHSVIDRVSFAVDDSPPVAGLDSASTQQVLPVQPFVDTTDAQAYETFFPATGDLNVSSWWQAGSTGVGIRRPAQADVIDRVDHDLAVVNEGTGEATLELSINETVVGTFTAQPGETEKHLSFSFPPLTRMNSEFYKVWLRVVEGNLLRIPLDRSSLTFYTPQHALTDRVTLSGSATDVGGGAVEAVGVELLDARGVSIGGRQPAELGDGRWQIDYRVPQRTNGRYTVRVEATDSVGNTTIREDETITIDGTPPGADLTRAGDGSGLLTGIDADAPIITGTVSDLPYPSGRQVHFHFEELAGATTFRDGSGRGMDATCTGATCPLAGQAGRFGAALGFNDSDFLSVESGTAAVPAFAPTDYTVASWVRSSAGGEQALFSAIDSTDPTRGLWLALDADGRLRHAYHPEDVEQTLISTGSLNDGEWHHVAAVKDGPLLALYVDGVREDTATTETDLDRPLVMTLGGSLAGLLDELVVYDRALTDAQIQALADPAASGVARMEIGFRHVKGTDLYQGLLAQLSFEELPGATGFADLSSNGHWGRCSGDSCPTSVEGGTFGRGLSFDGVDDEVSLGPVLLGGPLTLSAWVKPASTQGTQTIIYHGLGADGEEGTVFLRIKDGYYEAGERRIDGNYVARSPVPPDDVGRWVHLTGVSYPGQWMAWSLYRNGTYEANSGGSSLPSYLPPQRVPLTIGSNGAGDDFFQGEIDEVAVYERSLFVPQKNGPRLYGYAIRALADPHRWRELEPDWPGAAFSPWHYAVRDVEGPYSIDLRLVDQFGHASQVPGLWSGEIDTRAPRIGLYDWTSSYQTGSYTRTIRFYRCTNRDYNLSDEGIQCPGVSTKSLEQNPICSNRGTINHQWYTERFSQTKLQRITTSCSSGLEPGDGPQTARACDAFGQCTTRTVDPFAPSDQVVSLQAEGSVLAQDAPPIPTLILTPTNPSVLTTTASITVAGRAYAPDYLRTLTVTVNSVPTSVLTWTVDTVTETAWSAAWTPAAQGVYTISVQAADWAGTVVTETPLSPVVYVDTAPPALNLTTDAITSSHFSDAGYVSVRGRVTDTVGVGRLQVRYGERGWDQATVPTDTNAFDAPVWSGTNVPPAGEWVTLTARATDLAGRTATVSRTVWADAEPPAPATVTLAYLDGGGARSVITPGVTIRDVSSPTLRIEWAGSTSGDVSRYLAGWTTSPTPDGLTSYPPSAREHTQTVGEAQRVYAHVIVEDSAGNRTIETRGPIYVDDGGTPAYVTPAGPDQPYHGWLEDDCNLLGVDDRAARNASSDAGNGATQRLYATWNTAAVTPALRLAWTGADWSTQGDLFIYLDTQPGGTSTAFTRPYASYTDTLLYLPGVVPTAAPRGESRTGPSDSLMEADTFIWAQDNATAWLGRWDGTAWIIDSQLPEAQYRFDPAVNRGQTDFYLPLSRLNLQPGDSLRLVAFATEDPTTGAREGLRLWATMPPANPLNSADVLGRRGSGGATSTFALSRAYEWPSLSAGICPNDGTVDGVPHVEVTAAPVGTRYRFLGDGLSHLWDPMFAGPPPDVSEALAFTDADHPPLFDGQEIEYAVRYHNPGPDAVTNLRATVTAHYGLRLPDGTGDHQRISLGDVAAGETISASFRGQVDMEQGVNWAAADVLIYDDAHPESGPPVEWVWIDHRLDGEPPRFYGVRSPKHLVSAGLNTLHGYAYDDSGVPKLSLAMETPDGGTNLLPCTDSTQTDGSWLCNWDTVATNGGRSPQDGDVFTVRLQAEDHFGQTGAWTNPRSFVVDTIPPTVTLSLEEGQVLNETHLVGNSAYALRGDIIDNHGLGYVEICEAGRCELANVWLASGPTSLHIDDTPDTPQVIDGAQSCIVRTFTVTDTFTIAEVRVGLNVTHADRGDLQVTLGAPSGAEAVVVGSTEDAGRNYDVLLDDAAAERLHVSDDDDPALPVYDRSARPDTPLSTFLGEEVAGTWTLTLCDQAPAQHDGFYNRARLILTPQDTAPRTGRWFYKVFGDLDGEDYVEHRVAIYGVDLVGNRVTRPLSLTVVMDTVPPDLTVTQWPTDPVEIGKPARMAGTVEDPGGVQAMRLTGFDPRGGTVAARIERQGTTWVYTDTTPFIYRGTYQLYVEAVDEAGNRRTVGPLTLTMRQPPAPICLPLIFNRYQAPPAAPDLVVERIVAIRDDIALVVKNQGPVPVDDSFWVDVYVNPDPIPTATNQIWNDLADEGLVWGITTPIPSGEAITLTIGDQYYWEEYSVFNGDLNTGTWIYAQADSANIDTDDGAVLENHEILGEDYNNISGVRLTNDALGSGNSELEDLALSPLDQHRETLSHGLPSRP
jgi:subtilisin-like proprotein convertase family protein